MSLVTKDIRYRCSTCGVAWLASWQKKWERETGMWAKETCKECRERCLYTCKNCLHNTTRLSVIWWLSCLGSNLDERAYIPLTHSHVLVQTFTSCVCFHCPVIRSMEVGGGLVWNCQWDSSIQLCDPVQTVPDDEGHSGLGLAAEEELWSRIV
jgi:hypothetical protein